MRLAGTAVPTADALSRRATYSRRASCQEQMFLLSEEIASELRNCPGFFTVGNRYLPFDAGASSHPPFPVDQLESAGAVRWRGWSTPSAGGLLGGLVVFARKFSSFSAFEVIGGPKLGRVAHREAPVEGRDRPWSKSSPRSPAAGRDRPSGRAAAVGARSGTAPDA